MTDESALIDENGRQSITARLNTDGKTVKKITADPSTHAMSVNDNTTGSDNGGYSAATDANSRVTMFAESSDGDGTLIALYSDSNGVLLVDST